MCDPRILSPTQLEIKEKRKQLGYDHLILQPSSNPELDGYAMCPTAHLDVPYWGPDIKIRSAMMNRDLITKDECSVCSHKIKLNTPEVKIWPDVPCSTDNQPCIDKFGADIETACVTIDPENNIVKTTMNLNKNKTPNDYDIMRLSTLAAMAWLHLQKNHNIKWN